MGKRAHELCEVLVDEYDGDAANVWKGVESGEELYARLRKLEAPGAADFQFIRPDPLEPDRVRTSLIATGPAVVRKHLAAYDKMTDRAVQERLGVESTKIDRNMIERAVKEEAAKQILGSSFRHAANGGREGLVRSSLADKTALGWVRVTKADPCYFCAMLASRGLEYGTYGKDSFDRSDARFVGSGDAKVHDHCGCSIKPVYSGDDEFLTRSQEFERMWYEYSSGSSAEAIRSFRRGYEGRQKAA